MQLAICIRIFRKGEMISLLLDTKVVTMQVSISELVYLVIILIESVILMVIGFKRGK